MENQCNIVTKNEDSEVSLQGGSEYILQLFEYAKLNPTELNPHAQSLKFSDSYRKDGNTKLLEVDAELLNKLCEGERFTVRGESDESSVLCTDSATFKIQEAETSNSLLLIPDIIIPDECENESFVISVKEVVGIHYKYLELKPMQPGLQKIPRILEKVPYCGSSSLEYGYKWNDLLDKIQASETELLQGLRDIKAYYIEDFDYHFEVLSSILNFIDSHSLPLNKLSKEEIIHSLGTTEPLVIIEQCFSYYFSLVDEEKRFYEINEVDVSRFCAEVLLKPAGNFNLHEFMNIWQQSVPEGVTTHLSQLRGLALVDRESSPPVVKYFPTSLLPSCVSEAFSVLFQECQKWTFEDILPYLKVFTLPNSNAVSLLNKYARASTINGIKYFIPRYAN